MVTENVNIIVSLRGGRRAARGIQLIGRSSRRATASVRGLGLALAAAAGVASVAALIRTADAATEVSNRIRVTTGTTEQFLAVQERLFQVSKKTAATIEDTSRIFQRLRVGTRDFGISSERVIGVVEELNAALLVSGATSREAGAALLQLGQGIASDKLGGEELRSLRENLAPLAQALADELGVGIGQLKALGEQGKLTARDVFTALENIDIFTEKLESGEVILTFAQSFNILRTEIVKFFEILQRSTGVTGAFNKQVLEFSDGLAERLVVALANAIRSSIGLVAAFENVRTTIAGVFNTVGGLINSFILIKDISIALVEVIIAPFVAARLLISGLILDIKKLGNRFSLISDESVAEQSAATTLNAEALGVLFVDIGERAKNIGSLLSDGVQAGAAEAAEALTPLQQFLLDIADGLEQTAKTAAPALQDDGGAPLTFLERAAERTDRNRTDAGAEDFALQQNLSEDIAGSFQEGFRAAIEDGDDIFQVMGDRLEQQANESLVEGFQKSFDDLQGILEETFESVAQLIGPIFGDAFGEAGNALSQALQGALAFVALQGLSALLGGGGNKSSSSNANVESAVTSTQAVRGIVAGPQEIAIANVGQNIEEAFQPVLQELRVQTGIAEQTLGAIQGAGSFTALSAETRALATGTAPAATS